MVPRGSPRACDCLTARACVCGCDWYHVWACAGVYVTLCVGMCVGGCVGMCAGVCLPHCAASLADLPEGDVHTVQPRTVDAANQTWCRRPDMVCTLLAALAAHGRGEV